MLSWIGLGSPTTVFVSLENKEGPVLSPDIYPPGSPNTKGQESEFLITSPQRELRSHSPAQRVADEFAAAALEEHLDVLLPAKEREQGLHCAVLRGALANKLPNVPEL